MSSGIGTYLASGAIPRENMAAHPLRSGLLNSIPYAGPTLAHVTGDVSGGFEARDKDPFEKLRKETGGQAAWRRAKPGALIGGLGAAGGSALVSALLAGRTPDEVQGGEFAEYLPLIAALTGAGALGGGVGGALGGVYDKAVSHNTSRGSQDAARRMKAEHPLLTALPFGDMIGASFYGGGAQLKENANMQREKRSSDTSMQHEFEQAVFRGFQKRATQEGWINSIRNSVQGKAIPDNEALMQLLQGGGTGALLGAGAGGLAGYGLGKEPDEETGEGGNKKLMALLGALGGAGLGAAGGGVKAFGDMQQANPGGVQLGGPTGPRVPWSPTQLLAMLAQGAGGGASLSGAQASPAPSVMENLSRGSGPR